jgi:Lrp/AsnC family leucine-responsive transcriptional regulator
MLETNYYLEESDLDDIDRRLLNALAANSRAPASSLAQVVGLTRQAVADRMERLQSVGIVQRFTVAINPDRLGVSVRAFVSITLLPACSEEAERSVIELLRRNPWVQDCYRVTGEDYFQVRVIAPNIDALKELVLALRATGVVQGTRTTLALETLFEKGSHDMVSNIAYGLDTVESRQGDIEDDLVDVGVG